MPDYRGMDKDHGRMYFDQGMYYPDQGDHRYFQGSDMMYYSSNGGSMGNNSSSNGRSSNGNGGTSGGNNANGGGTRGYTEREFPIGLRDEREGRSPMSRKSYIESKEMHQDKNIKLKELEKYMQELSTDMVEMIQGASPEEKQLLEKRISALATKISQVNV